LIANKFPFEAPNKEDLFDKISKGKFKFEGSNWNKLKDNLCKDFITKCLNLD
jgi:hypothetical protein